VPKAIERPFSVFAEGLAWYSIDGSLRELRQMAHVSAQMSHDHMVTAFHSEALRQYDEQGDKGKNIVRIAYI
jgi:hypothetical protein